MSSHDCARIAHATLLLQKRHEKTKEQATGTNFLYGISNSAKFCEHKFGLKLGWVQVEVFVFLTDIQMEKNLFI